VAQDSGVSEEKTKMKLSGCSKLARGLILAFAVMVCLSGNVLAQQKPFLVLDIYAKAVTAAERDPLAPIEQDLMKGKDPETPKNFSHLITETFSLKPNPQPFGVLDGAIEDQLINLSFTERTEKTHGFSRGMNRLLNLGFSVPQYTSQRLRWKHFQRLSKSKSGSKAKEGATIQGSVSARYASYCL
jgi:hypothetical protein